MAYLTAEYQLLIKLYELKRLLVVEFPARQ